MNYSIAKPLPYAWKHAYLSYDKPIDQESNIILKYSSVIPMMSEIDFAYAAIYDDHIVFSFMGTGKDIHAWLSDLDPYPLRPDEYSKRVLVDGEWGKGIIHDGFYTGWKFFKTHIDEIVKSYDISKFNIITCGHSRGGALAELCSRHLAKKYNKPNSCFTFGCPGVGTKEYRDQFRLLPINGTRVVNGWDIVPRLPPQIFGFKFGCANLVWNERAWLMKFIPHLGISDHLSANYDKFITKKYLQ